ncbi:hypothetical protein EKK58_09465 [Candidatus Dependentiae bacterium]|nr:MAG: hypothetical protein EKK58_09465 [Candidatus Dependentiae bacterium]
MDFYTTELLAEGALNDDMLHIANEGYKFKGGYVAIVEYYTFANSWGNYKRYKRFKTLENAYKFIDKNYRGE